MFEVLQISSRELFRICSVVYVQSECGWNMCGWRERERNRFRMLLKTLKIIILMVGLNNQGGKLEI